MTQKWSDEVHIPILRKLWSEGLLIKTIAGRMGFGKTLIVTKRRDLGLSPRQGFRTKGPGHTVPVYFPAQELISAKEKAMKSGVELPVYIRNVVSASHP